MRLPILAAALLSASLGACASAPDAREPELTLVRTVMLMRHGVRPPTRLPVTPPGYAREDWPTWSTEPGKLTPHGYRGVVLVGAWDRQLFAGQGLVPAEGCPPAGAIRVHANTDQRTRESGRAFLEGFAPGCDIDVEHADGDRNDPLFQSVDMGLTGHRRIDGQAAVMARVDGDLGRAMAPVAGAFARLDDILDCCSAPVCEEAGLAAGCRLADIPHVWAETADGKRVDFDGPLAVGGTAVQSILLAYLEGMPMEQVGWGRVTEADLPLLSSIHAVEFDLLARTPYVAAYNGTPITDAVLEAFARAGGPVLTLLIGHDTNAANVAGMLDLHWAVPGYAPDDPAVGGGLGFELLTDAQGARFVRVFYQAQTPRQLRELAPLTNAAPPSFDYLDQPTCALPDDPTLCPLDDFVAAVQARSRR